MKLTTKQIDALKPAATPYRKHDTQGLYLHIFPVSPRKPAGSKKWRMKFQYQNKAFTLSFGDYPEISLSDARQNTANARLLLAKGINPAVDKRESRHLISRQAECTFTVVASQWHVQASSTWAPVHAHDVWRRLELHILPTLGKCPITSIKAGDILRLITQVEARGSTDISHRLVQDCSRIFRFAIISGQADYNPAADLRGALKQHRTRHLPTIEFKELPAFFTALRIVSTSDLNKIALQLLLHTFVRSGELRTSYWSDVDFENREWRIPAERMKKPRPHVVPLSDEALQLFRQLYLLTSSHPSGLILPNQQNRKHPMMSENTLNKVLENMGYKDKLVGHGFRALASTTLNERGYSPEAIELQLSHIKKDRIAAAYNRSSLMDARRKLMEDWSALVNQQHLASLKAL